MLSASYRREACRAIQRVSKATVLALMGSSLNDPVPNNPLNPAAATFKPFFLRTIPLDHWEVMSFNPVKREVCVLVYRYDEYGQRTGDYRVISLTLPVIAVNPNS